jgi:hypothetical protein
VNMNSGQAVRWVRQLRKNLERARALKDPAERSAFLIEQYRLLALLKKAVDGRVKFLGVPSISRGKS